MGIDEDSQIEVRVASVEVSGMQGRVTSDLFVDGESLEFDENSDDGQRWVFVDGQWWQEDEDWEKGCTEIGFEENSSLTPAPSQTATATPPPTTSYALGDLIVLDATLLLELWGEPELNGQIQVTFSSISNVSGIEDQICGTGRLRAKGRFVAIYYSITNDANSRIQPSTQINNHFVLTDDEGRQWAENSVSGHCFLEANFSTLAGGEGPETWIDPGFSGETAIVFDVSETASSLRLQSSRLEVGGQLES